MFCQVLNCKPSYMRRVTTNLIFKFLKLSFSLLPVFLYFVLGLFFSLFQATCFPCNLRFHTYFYIGHTHPLTPSDTEITF